MDDLKPGDNTGAEQTETDKIVEFLTGTKTLIKEEVSTDSVIAEIQKIRVKEEFEKRVKAIDKGLRDVEALEKEIKKLDHEDLVLERDKFGKATKSTFSEARAKELKEKTEKLAKLRKNVLKALEGDLSGLNG